MIVRKTAAELEKMRRSGLLVWQILQKLREMAVEGVSTHGPGSGGGEDDRAMPARSPRLKVIMCRRRASGISYVLCTSVNEEIVHGMPNAEAGSEEGRYRFDRYRSAAGRVFRRFGPDGADRRSERADEEAAEGDARNRWNWRSSRCATATGCSIFAGRWSST